MKERHSSESEQVYVQLIRHSRRPEKEMRPNRHFRIRTYLSMTHCLQMSLPNVWTVR